MVLTGTPIENHLEEIWSLFRFIAPGLLGSREDFQKRFLSSVTSNNTAKTTKIARTNNTRVNTNTSNIANSNTKNIQGTTRDQQELKRQGLKKLI